MTGQAPRGMNRRAPRFARRSPSPRRCSGSSRARRRSSRLRHGWRPFTATWTLSGQRQTLETEGGRPASIVHLTGTAHAHERRGARPRPSRRGDRLRRRRRSSSSAGSVFMDDRGGPDLLRPQGRADRQRPPRHGHDHGRHGAVRRPRGRVLVRLAVRRGRRRAARSACAPSNVAGRTRRPRPRSGGPMSPAAKTLARARRRLRPRRRRSGSGRCPTGSRRRPGISSRSSPRRSPR